MTDAKTRLEKAVFARIPLAAAMRIRAAEYERDRRLILEAPLAPNLNHEGIGFGGAIECLGTLACWGLVWLTLDDPRALIVIQHSEVHFVTPIEGALRAETRPPGPGVWRHFSRVYARRGLARIDLEATVGDPARADAARFGGRFVARRKVQPTV